MNIQSITTLLAEKSGSQSVTIGDEALICLSDFLVQSDIADYLRHCLPQEVLEASGIRLLPLDAIVQEMNEGVAPGGYIRPFGYLVVATSIGGNAICFHSISGQVFLVDHTSFADDCISYKDRVTDKWQYIYEYTPENVAKPMIHISDDIEGFLNELLTGQLTEKLETLD